MSRGLSAIASVLRQPRHPKQTALTLNKREPRKVKELKRKTYENICCSNLQSWARVRCVRRETRRKKTTEEKAAASGAARTSVHHGTSDGRCSGHQENVNGS